MSISILKFGGTSMSDHHTWKKVLSIIGSYDQPVVVVSATARTTRMLLKAAEYATEGNTPKKEAEVASIQNRHIDIIDGFLEGSSSTEFKNRAFKHLEVCIERLNEYLNVIQSEGSISLKNRDAIASIGEQISSFLLVECGKAAGLNCKHIDARTIIKTDSTFGKANPDLNKISDEIKSLQLNIDAGSIPIMGGFYGEDENGDITTLGFEGSDYTASLIGAALMAETVEIWTDVSGVYTSDPRFIKDAKPISNLSYSEATEMAYYGAKVLHPSTLKPLQKLDIPLWVKNMFEADADGTKISNAAASAKTTLALSFSTDICIVTANAPETLMGYEFLRKVFATLESVNLPVELVTTTEASVSIAIPYSDAVPQLISKLLSFSTVSEEHKLGLIRIIGTSHSTIGTMKTSIFEGIDKTDIRMMSFSKGKKNLNIIVSEEDLIPTAQIIHTNCFSSN